MTTDISRRRSALLRVRQQAQACGRPGGRMAARCGAWVATRVAVLVLGSTLMGVLGCEPSPETAATREPSPGVKPAISPQTHAQTRAPATSSPIQRQRRSTWGCMARRSSGDETGKVVRSAVSEIYVTARALVDLDEGYKEGGSSLYGVSLKRVRPVELFYVST